MGKGAIVSVMTKYLHPSKLIRDKFPNSTASLRLEGLVVVGEEEQKVCRRTQKVIVLTIEEFKNGDEFIPLYAVPRWVKVETEGPRSDVMEEENDVEVVEEREVETVIPINVVETVSVTGKISENQIQDLIANGIEVNDDNMPLEENVPTGTQEDKVFRDQWGHDGICFCHQSGGQKVKAVLLVFPRDVLPMPVQLFEHLFPRHT